MATLSSAAQPLLELAALISLQIDRLFNGVSQRSRWSPCTLDRLEPNRRRPRVRWKSGEGSVRGPWPTPRDPPQEIAYE